MTKLIIYMNDDEKGCREITTSCNCRPIDLVAIFDDGCPGWERNHEHNELFLKMQQNYANDLLRAKGYLLLNDVYDILGYPKTKVGGIVGWYDDGEKFVDFGLNSKLNERFKNGDTNTVVLEFNVDGEILSKL